jgi:SAM-dependent methyltransferase
VLTTRHQESEPWRFPARYFELLDHIAGRIRPDDASLDQWFSNYSGQHRSRLAADLRIVEQHVEPNAKILECGAIPLIATGAFAELGYEVSAIDIAPERFMTAITSLGLDVRKCDLERERTPFANESFDAVVFNEIFEHLRINPISTLEEVRRVLKRGGVLLLSTPNLRSFRGIRNLLLHHQGSAASHDIYRQFEKLEAIGHMGHVREYTAMEVSDFLAHLGFRTDTVIYRGGYGRGIVGLAERLAPSLRPSFSLVATKEGDIS